MTSTHVLRRRGHDARRGLVTAKIPHFGAIADCTHPQEPLSLPGQAVTGRPYKQPIVVHTWSEHRLADALQQLTGLRAYHLRSREPPD